MKAVLLSVNPQHVHNIANVIGEKDGKPLYKKTIEVRKTKPNLETPFKVYIYCTKAKEMHHHGCIVWYEDSLFSTDKGEIKYGSSLELWGNNYEQCVILNGKVIGEFVCDEITPLFNVATTSWNLLAGNVHEYAKGLVRMARLTEEEMHSYANGKNCYAWHISDLKIYDKPKEFGEFNHDTILHTRFNGYKEPITRPPQSWCYVEELNG